SSKRRTTFRGGTTSRDAQGQGRGQQQDGCPEIEMTEAPATGRQEPGAQGADEEQGAHGSTSVIDGHSQGAPVLEPLCEQRIRQTHRGSGTGGPDQYTVDNE